MRAQERHQPDPPVKAIPPARDRLQSRLLVIVAVPALCWVAWNAGRYALAGGHLGKIYLSMAVAVSALFGLAAWRLRAATATAAGCGALICFDITVLSGRPDGRSIFHSGLSPLILLFVITHAATRFRRDRKDTPGLEGAGKHGRNAAQVIANLGVAGVVSLQYHSVFRSLPHPQIGTLAFVTLQIPMLSALAEATADTVSSEIGQAVGGKPFLLVNLRRVAPGTDGAISAVGTLAGVTGATVVALIARPALGLNTAAMIHVVVAATGGLFFDSLLGATVERRGWIGNDAVNFSSTLFAAALACFLDPAVFA